MAGVGGMGVGSGLGGGVAEIHHVGFALIVAGLVQFVALVSVRPCRLTDVDDLGLAPIREFTAPDTQVAVDARSGPVVITITYTIAEQDEVAFLTVMAERRRIRRRDGDRKSVV